MVEPSSLSCNISSLIKLALIGSNPEKGSSKINNLLKNAPHTARHISSDEWDHPYSREKAAYPAPWQKEFKFWPSVGRIDNAYGDRNLVCTCPPIDAYED